MAPAEPTPILDMIFDIEPSWSARESAVLLKRSYSWLDSRLRRGEFVRPDGTVVAPIRTPGGYRRFDLETLREIALSSYRRHWFTRDDLDRSLHSLAAALATHEYEIGECAARWPKEGRR